MIAITKKFIAAVARAISSFVVSQWNSYTTFGQFLFVLAIAAIAIDAAICYQYGLTLTKLHAAGFALVAIAFAILPDVATTELEKGKKGSAITLGTLVVILAPVAYQAHLGYGASIRSGDMQETAVQNTKYEGAQEAVSEDKANIDLWKKQLATLLEQNAWAPTVKAESMRSELATLKDRIEEEKKGKRGRKPGCGKECERLQNEANALETRIGIAEQASNLTNRIEATQRIIDSKRQVASNTEFKASAVVNTNAAFVKLYRVAMGDKPEDAIKDNSVLNQFVNIFLVGSGALAFILLAPGFMFAAGRNRKPFAIVEEHSAHLGADDIHLATAQNQQGQTSVTREITRLDPMVKHEVHEIKERDPRISSLDAFLASYITRAA